MDQIFQPTPLKTKAKEGATQYWYNTLNKIFVCLFVCLNIYIQYLLQFALCYLVGVGSFFYLISRFYYTLKYYWMLWLIFFILFISGIVFY